MKIRYRKYGVVGASGALAVVVATAIGFMFSPKIYGLLYISLACLVIACAIMFSISFNATKIKNIFWLVGFIFTGLWILLINDVFKPTKEIIKDRLSIKLRSGWWFYVFGVILLLISIGATLALIKEPVEWDVVVSVILEYLGTIYSMVDISFKHKKKPNLEDFIDHYLATADNITNLETGDSYVGPLQPSGQMMFMDAKYKKHYINKPKRFSNYRQEQKDQADKLTNLERTLYNNIRVTTEEVQRAQQQLEQLKALLDQQPRDSFYGHIDPWNNIERNNY